VPSPFADAIQAAYRDPHVEYCLRLANSLQDSRDSERRLAMQSEQVVMSSGPHVLTSLESLHEWHCANLHKVRGGDLAVLEFDPRAALLHFMAIATPNEKVVEDIMTRFQDIVDNMSSSIETHFVGSHGVMVEIFDNVPDAVSPVKTKLVYTQVPEGDATVLRLVWRVRASQLYIFHPLTLFLVSLKSRCRIIGMRLRCP
jgi:extracellular elastinolytic metalloproteinase